MDDEKLCELPAGAGKQVDFVRVYRDDQDREVLIRFTDGTELSIALEVRSITSAVDYQARTGLLEPLARYDEPPADAGPFSATITASLVDLMTPAFVIAKNATLTIEFHRTR
jgi:hypothetical protein